MITCLRGHSSSIYNFAINAFFFSHTSDDIEVFILVDRVGEKGQDGEEKTELSQERWKITDSQVV